MRAGRKEGVELVLDHFLDSLSHSDDTLHSQTAAQPSAMANALYPAEERRDEAAVEPADEAEPIPSIAQLTAAIDPTVLQSVTALHTRWTAYLASHAPSLSLSPPASASDLHALSAFVTSQNPPDSPPSPSSPSFALSSLSCLRSDVLSHWLCADGESWSSSGGGALGNFSLLSARQALREYQTLCELADNNLLPKPASSLAPRFTRAYIPVAASAASHYLLAPIHSSSAHQPLPVLLLPSDGSRVWAVAASFQALLGRIVDALESERWQFDERLGEWTGEGAEGFCAVWDAGGKEWEARQDGAVRQYDESALMGLTRDLA